MTHARLEGTGQRVAAADSEELVGQPFVCDDQACGVRVILIGSFTRQVQDRRIRVRAYFRLAKAIEHKLGCKFRIDRAVERIARASEPANVRMLEDGVFEFRLLLPESTQGTHGEQSPYLETSEESRQTVFVSKGKAIPYLRSLRQLLKLREAIEDDTQLRSIAKLRFGSTKVAWRDFFFTCEDFLRCYERLAGTGGVLPCCLSGTVKTIAEPKASFRYYSVQLHSPFVERGSGIRRIPVASVKLPAGRTWSARVVDTVKPECGIVAFGLWKTSESEVIAGAWQFLRLALFPPFPQQILVIT